MPVDLDERPKWLPKATAGGLGTLLPNLSSVFASSTAVSIHTEIIASTVLNEKKEKGQRKMEKSKLKKDEETGEKNG